MEELIIGRVLEVFAVLVLGSYFPILTYSFFKYRLARKREELAQLLGRVRLESQFNTQALHSRLEKEYSPQDYFLPVFFVSMITFFGMTILFTSWMVFEYEGIYKSVLFSGYNFWTDTILSVEKRSLSVVAFAIMGGYISATQYIHRRFSTVDLTPGNFFSVGLRMILAALTSLMLSFVLPDEALFNPNLILVIGFLTGLMPENGLRLLLDKVKIFPSKSDKAYENFGLNTVEGISDLHRIRLNEVGIDNVQNLAQFSFMTLILKTPFPVRTLIDWVSQAKLIVEFQNDFDKLQKVGVRTVLDFLDAFDETPDRFQEVADISGINRLALEINYQNLKNDQSVTLLNHFRHNLEQFHLDE